MRTLGLPISHKENEFRRAILPLDIKNISCANQIYVEKGFGDVLNISDEEYLSVGCNISSHEDVLKCDIICDPKIGDADYLEKLKYGTTIFGWVHATQNRDITDKILLRKLTAIAWEKMFFEGRHIFWFNNELAGEAAIINAFQCYGQLPYGLNVAVIGNGNVARGAIRVLNIMGAKVIQYNRRQENLLRMELGKYDVIVNAILWDVSRKDHIISRKDLGFMKKSSMIIDVSCDRNGAIETSVPTTIENPTYIVDGIMHYVVDHTPSLFYKTFSINNSKIIAEYIEDLILDRSNKIIDSSTIIREGCILDMEIIDHQRR